LTRNLRGIVLMGLLFGPLQLTRYSSKPTSRPAAGASRAVLWRKPENIKARDLFFGPGGPEHAPKGKFVFIKENLKGTQPKFVVRDSNNVEWGVKVGKEARVETAATRLLWAVGYFADEEYYVAELPFKGTPPLRRGEMAQSGKAVAVRMKRHIESRHKIGYWRWDSNPFVGTRELNGLKVMMELMNNTDFKKEHLVVYDMGGVEQCYMVKDLGASFGRAGSDYFGRAGSKGILKDFEHYDLIRDRGPQYVDFWYFKHVPRKDAKWIGDLAGQLSDQQIREAFRAGGFSQAEVEGFARKLREKINELRRL
ncbi:MAG: hypothetical protein ACM3SW_05300, partial [Actinomycetota bacterium]